MADVTMPLMTGIEAAHQLREAGLPARLVFLTIHSESEFIRACLAEGALGYVIKTRINDDLIPAIDAVMTGRAVRLSYSWGVGGSSVNSSAT